MRPLTLQEFCARATPYERWRAPISPALRRGAWSGMLTLLVLTAIGWLSAPLVEAGLVWWQPSLADTAWAERLSAGILVSSAGIGLPIGWLAWRTAGFRHGTATQQWAAAVLSDTGACCVALVVWTSLVLAVLTVLSIWCTWRLTRLVWHAGGGRRAGSTGMWSARVRSR